MCEEVLLGTLSKGNWLRIADEFNEKWNFPLCVGAIDGKHIVIQVKSMNTLFLTSLIDDVIINNGFFSVS